MESNTILDARQAVQLAKQKAAEMLDQQPYNLEEIERDDYKGHDVWDITLSFLPNANVTTTLGLIVNAGRQDLQYKRFLIDAGSGELIAMKLREPAIP